MESKYIFLKPEELTLINRCASNYGPSKYLKQLLRSMKEDIVSKETIVGNFNTLLCLIGQLDQQTKNHLKNIGLKERNGKDGFSRYRYLYRYISAKFIYFGK